MTSLCLILYAAKLTFVDLVKCAPRRRANGARDPSLAGGRMIIPLADVLRLRPFVLIINLIVLSV